MACSGGETYRHVCGMFKRTYVWTCLWHLNEWTLVHEHQCWLGGKCVEELM